MKELDRIYDWADTLMSDGRLSELDEGLATVKVEDTPMELLLGYLTATLPVKSSLPARKKLYEEVRLILMKRDEDHLALLKGLE